MPALFIVLGIVLLSAVIGAAAIVVIGIITAGMAQAATCQPGTGASVNDEKLAGGGAGFDAEQLRNAAAIVAAGKALNLPVAGQVLGIQCAIGESTLRVLPFGDLAGPDSRGLFQQRDNGAWGTLADRLDPGISATNFFKALMRVPDWQNLEATVAINRVQGNANVNHYTTYRAQAEQVFELITGAKVPVGGGNGSACTAGQVIGEIKGNWALPLSGATMSSPYGPRSLDGFHFGIDFSTARNLPGGTVVAATDMTVVKATDVDGGTGAGTHVKGQSLDGAYTMGYYHMVTGSLKVKVGDTVAAGTPLGTEGSTGNVTGRHVHFEVFPGRQADPWAPTFPTVDPALIFAQKGLQV